MEFISSIVEWWNGQMAELEYLGELLATIREDAENWFTWLPVEVVVLLSFGVTLAILLKFLGR